MMCKSIRLALWVLLSVFALHGPPVAARCLDRPPPLATPPGSFSPLLFGVNVLFTEATDDVRARPQFLQSLEAIPIDSVRFPGGTIADNYLWREKKTARADWGPHNYRASGNDLDFDELMATSKCIGAQPTIVLNLRTWVANGDIEAGIAEAEDWVRYANIQKHYGIRYWELGNELYGRKNQRRSPLRASDYGRYYALFRKRLKAIDPTIQLGLALTKQVDWVAAGDVGPWWDEAVKNAGGDIDYIIIHDYVAPSGRRMLRRGSTLDLTLGEINLKLKALVGRTVPIHVTEWNKGTRPSSKPDIVRNNTIGHALFVADGLLDMAESGVQLANYWPLFRGHGHERGLLNSGTLELNAPGRVMQLLAPLAGWRITRTQVRQPPDLQFSLLAAGDDQHRAVVAINWSPRDATVDWKALVGGCSASVRALQPSLPARGPEGLNNPAREESTDNVTAAYSLAGFSVAVIRVDSAASCH